MIELGEGFFGILIVIGIVGIIVEVYLWIEVGYVLMIDREGVIWIIIEEIWEVLVIVGMIIEDLVEVVLILIVMIFDRVVVGLVG